MKTINFVNKKHDLTRFFGNHITPMQITLEKKETTYSGIITAFIISIKNEWFLMTAGHCLKDIENERKRGSILKECFLIDSLGTKQIDNHLLPFNYDALTWVEYNEETDFGVISIQGITKNSLITNGIIPFNENVWKKQPENPDGYLLLGVPSELSSEKRSELIYQEIRPLKIQPICFKKINPLRFYGEIELPLRLTTIKGMSGGPILSFKKINGEIRYWLHAIQNSWCDKRYISACSVKPFLDKF